MSDGLSDGRRVRMFNVIDDYNREAIAEEPGLSFPKTRVTRVLNQLEEEIGLPKVIRVDNGPEFISKDLLHGVREKLLRYATSNLASPCKTASLKDSIELLERTCKMRIGLRI